jgi:hypothetical protein
MLTRLIYASEANASVTPETVQSILSQARVVNARRGLSGMLVFDSQVFLQVLEGPRADVDAVYASISRDPRHRRVVLLELAATNERHFGRWSMAFAPADATHRRLYLRHCKKAQLDPFQMTPAAALALLKALTPALDPLPGDAQPGNAAGAGATAPAALARTD